MAAEARSCVGSTVCLSSSASVAAVAESLGMNLHHLASVSALHYRACCRLQVLRRYGDGSMQVVHTQDEMPTLKEVALTLLPNS